MQRSIPGKAENGASRSTPATLIRQANVSGVAPAGLTAISRVSPAPREEMPLSDTQRYVG